MEFNSAFEGLNPICHLLALLGAHPILHVSRIRVKEAAHSSSRFGTSQHVTFRKTRSCSSVGYWQQYCAHQLVAWTLLYAGEGSFLLVHFIGSSFHPLLSPLLPPLCSDLCHLLLEPVAVSYSLTYRYWLLFF